MMKWFNNISIRTKLFLSFALIIVVLAIATAYGFSTIKVLQTSQKNLQDVFFANAIDASDLETNINENRVLVMSMVYPNKPSLQKELLQRTNKISADTDQIMKKMHARSANNPKLVKRLYELEKVWQEFDRTMKQHTLPLIQAGKFEEARGLLLGSQRESYLKLRGMLHELYLAAVKEAEDAGDRSTSKINDVFFILGGIMVLVLLVSLFLAVSLNRTIAAPLKEITGTATKLATGDLDVKVPSYDRKDEVGSLAQGFEVMVRSLQNIAKAAEQIADGDLTVALKPRSSQDMLALSFGIMTENLRGLVQEIQEGANNLQALSGETNKLANQIVADSKEIEGAVAETAANLQKAKQVSELSTQQEVWLALMESAVERIQRASAGGGASAQQVMTTAINLDEIGGRMRLFVGKLRV